MFAERRLPCDVGLVQVSAPDRNGMCSLGIGVDYVADAMPHTPVLIAEINAEDAGHGWHANGFRSNGSPRPSATDRPLAEDPLAHPARPSSASPPTSPSSSTTATPCKLGVGSLGAAVLDALAEHEDLGFHTGMVTDGLLRLVDKGVATGSRKEIDPGLIVAGTALGYG